MEKFGRVWFVVFRKCFKGHKMEIEVNWDMHHAWEN
jgi:hypothetical protein